MQMRTYELNGKDYIEFKCRTYKPLLSLKGTCKGKTWLHSDFEHFVLTGEWLFKLTEELI